jgi:hypothetical protein
VEGVVMVEIFLMLLGMGFIVYLICLAAIVIYKAIKGDE